VPGRFPAAEGARVDSRPGRLGRGVTEETEARGASRFAATARSESVSAAASLEETEGPRGELDLRRTARSESVSARLT